MECNNAYIKDYVLSTKSPRVNKSLNEEDIIMNQTSEEKRNFGRLEDFIEIAKAGKQVELKVELREQSMIQSINTGELNDAEDKISTYLLIANYTFKIDDQSHALSKVYMFATFEESLTSSRMNRTIANARLQVDYNRLKAAHINFHEKFF